VGIEKSGPAVKSALQTKARRAMLTHCGQTLTPDQKALKIGFGLLFEGLTLLLGLIFFGKI